MARPAVYLGSDTGDVARYLKQHRCGCVAGSGEALAGTILRLAEDTEALGDMGRRAGRLARAQFGLSRSQTRWEALLNELGFHPAAEAKVAAREVACES